eukprot:5270198-Ditylum_brightwellii.AAC.1
MKHWCQITDKKNTQPNGTSSNGNGTETVRFETSPSEIPYSEEQGDEHPTMSSCAIDQLQNQPVSESTKEGIADLEEDGLESVDLEATNSATGAVIKQTLEINNEFPFSPDEDEKAPTCVEIDGF